MNATIYYLETPLFGATFRQMESSMLIYLATSIIDCNIACKIESTFTI